MKAINERGLVLVGCGFMGRALLEGWLAAGVRPEAMHVQDPSPSDWLRGQGGLHLNAALPEDPAVLVIAVKPQLLDQVLPSLARFGGGGTLVVTIVTGYPAARYETALGAGPPVVRAMPNLPSAVGSGVTVYARNGVVDAAQAQLAAELFGAVGTAIELEDEATIHAVTGISGSGPAYVFAMAEAMTRAGEAMGLPPDLAARLALHTIGGAADMMRQTGTPPAELRRAVTSPAGTTAAALRQLTAPGAGLDELMERTAKASRDRSVELGA